MKNSLDSAMQGIEGLINSDGTGENLASLKHGEFGESPARVNTEPSLVRGRCNDYRASE